MGQSRRRILGLATVGIAGALAGCESSDTASPTPSAETEPTSQTETETESTSQTETETESTAQTEPGTSESDHVVAVGDGGLRFSPETIEISVGDTIRWEWESNGHNVKPATIPDESDWSGTPGGESETFDSGYSYTHTFETAGEYDYYCDPHRGRGMTGSITVS